METAKFRDYINYREGKENFEQPHIIAADPPFKLPRGIERLSDAYAKSKEVPIGKEVDTKAGGEKDVTMKSRKLFVVGGAVRDYLLGHTPSNYNLCTDAHPEEVMKIMQSARPPIHVIRKDLKKGSVTVSVDGERYTIDTMRRESKSANGSKNEEGGVTFTTNPAEDAEGRDFTCNSLYYDVMGKKIYDYTGGIRHLKDGVIKFIGKPDEKLGEDGTRKFRYAHLLNKVPNAKIDDEAKEAINKLGIDDDMPPEKIRDEFWRGMEDLHTSAEKYLKTYEDLGLLKTVFPKLELSLDFPKCKTCKSRPIVLASLLKNNKPTKLVQVLKKLHYTDREIKDAVFLVNLLLFSPEYIHDFKNELTNTSLTKRQVMDWAKINNLKIDMIEKLMDYRSQVSSSDIMSRERLSGDNLKERVRTLEAVAFQKYLRD